MLPDLTIIKSNASLIFHYSLWGIWFQNSFPNCLSKENTSSNPHLLAVDVFQILFPFPDLEHLQQEMVGRNCGGPCSDVGVTFPASPRSVRLDGWKSQVLKHRVTNVSSGSFWIRYYSEIWNDVRYKYQISCQKAKPEHHVPFSDLSDSDSPGCACWSLFLRHFSLSQRPRWNFGTCWSPCSWMICQMVAYLNLLNI